MSSDFWMPIAGIVLVCVALFLCITLYFDEWKPSPVEEKEGIEDILYSLGYLIGKIVGKKRYETLTGVCKFICLTFTSLVLFCLVLLVLSEVVAAILDGAWWLQSKDGFFSSWKSVSHMEGWSWSECREAKGIFEDLLSDHTGISFRCKYIFD